MFDYLSILGPTASGKTALAIHLGKYFPIEVISVDSVSFYQGLDIGSAKPTYVEQEGIPHHLIDVVTLKDTYTCGRFIEEAPELIKAIKARGNIPVFCGGTMMYMHAFQQGYANLPTIDPSTVHALLASEAKGVASLYQVLSDKDPVMAGRIHPNDTQRIQRALGVLFATGKSLSEYWHKSPSIYRGFDILLDCNDRLLHREKLTRRVDQMLSLGLAQECESIVHQFGVEVLSHPAMRSIGYKEMGLYMCEKITLDDVRDLSITASCQYVKRQTTWVKSWKNKDSKRVSLYDDNQDINKLVCSVVEKMF